MGKMMTVYFHPHPRQLDLPFGHDQPSRYMFATKKHSLCGPDMSPYDVDAFGNGKDPVKKMRKEFYERESPRRVVDSGYAQLNQDDGLRFYVTEDHHFLGATTMAEQSSGVTAPYLHMNETQLLHGKKC